MALWGLLTQIWWGPEDKNVKCYQPPSSDSVTRHPLAKNNAPENTERSRADNIHCLLLYELSEITGTESKHNFLSLNTVSSFDPRMASVGLYPTWVSRQGQFHLPHIQLVLAIREGWKQPKFHSRDRLKE